MSHLQRDKAPISTRKGPRQNHLGQTGDRGWAQRPSRWLAQRQAMHRTLRIIVEQSREWDSSLIRNFVDCERAFDSLDKRDTLWTFLQHYGIPDTFISLIRITYEDMTCRVIHAGQLTDSFMVKTGVRDRCRLSPFLFLFAIDWITKKKLS